MTDLERFTERRAEKRSGGMKQKLGSACSMLEQPELLLLGEPTVGVDPVSRRELWTIVYDLLERQRIGVVLATSYLDEADRCSRVMVLDRGRKLDEGTPRAFHRTMRGRVFAVQPADTVGPRTIQARLANGPRVVDATIRSGHVRCVLQRPEEADLAAALPPGDTTSISPLEPNFEDAFRALWPRAEHAFAVQGASADAAVAQTDGDPVVCVQKLTKRFGDFTAVADIHFKVRRGEVLELLGCWAPMGPARRPPSACSAG